MNRDDFLNRAKAGDPEAIAEILNCRTRHYKVRTRAASKDNRLVILFESLDEQPNAQLKQFVKGVLTRIHPANVDTVQLYGRLTSTKKIIWHHDFSLGGLADVPNDTEPLEPDNQLPVSPDVPETTTAIQNDKTGVTETEPGNDFSDLETPQSDNTDQASPQASVDEPLEELSAVQPETGLDLARSPTQPSQEPSVEESSTDQSSADEPLAENAPSSGIEWLARPEAVVLLVFVSVVLIWQVYLSFLEDIAPEESLSNSELARRLSVLPSTVRLWRQRPSFEHWSRGLDPDGIGWRYEKGRFWPQLDDVEASLSRNH